MTAPTLDKTLEILRANESMLRARGVVHAAVFGSVARGEAGPDSDVDILVDLEPGNPSGMFEYVRLKIDVANLLGQKVDLIERNALKPLFREDAARDVINVF